MGKPPHRAVVETGSIRIGLDWAPTTDDAGTPLLAVHFVDCSSGARTDISIGARIAVNDAVENSGSYRFVRYHHGSLLVQYQGVRQLKDAASRLVRRLQERLKELSEEGVDLIKHQLDLSAIADAMAVYGDVSRD